MSIWAGIPHQLLWQCSSRHLAHATGTSSRVVLAQPAVSFLCSSVLAVPQHLHGVQRDRTSLKVIFDSTAVPDAVALCLSGHVAPGHIPVATSTYPSWSQT